ncbi:LysR family transcriptional regulator [Neorhizobium sp. NPDC001467]|uniref:LysR family transcriptional regulator n=1 Tax=Neorhizobium sp. NPDC001467 TaxID=3390595 RepID=UPI003D080D37
MDNSWSWDDQKYFLAVLELGSFAKAARKLGVSHPTVRSRIGALETLVGTVLFVRSGSGLVPTASARALREPAQAMADAAHRFARHATSSDTTVSGRVRLSVPEVVGTDVLPRMLRSLRDVYPMVSVELVLTNGLSNLLTNEADIAVRTVQPEQESLVIRKVAAVALGLFAAHDYISRRGSPTSVEDLRNHDLIGPDRGRAEWELASTLGLNEGMPTFVIRTDSHPAQIAAARAGIGIVACQVPLGISDAGLCHILPEVVVHTIDTWVVAHENVLKIPRVRAVYDHLVNSYKLYASGSPSAGPFLSA